jgi:WD40 repeat protein
MTSIITRADRARDIRQWELAARLYRKALNRNPKNPPIWLQYGHVLKESGKPTEAESAYRIAIGYQPGASDAHLHLGHVLKLRGKRCDAEAAYLRALAIDPMLPEPLEELRRLGWSNAHLAELKQAVEPKPSYRYEVAAPIPSTPAPEREPSVKIFDAKTGELRHQLSHGPPVQAVAFSPDGKHVAAGNLMGEIRIWETANGTCRHVLQGHEESVNGVAFSPDGRTLAAVYGDYGNIHATLRYGSPSGGVVLWDMDSRGRLQPEPLSVKEGIVVSVAFSPDGKHVATASSDMTAKVWTTTNGHLVLTLRGHTARINGIAYSPDGTRLATISEDGNRIEGRWEYDEGGGWKIDFDLVYTRVS